MTYIKWKDEVESYLVNLPQEEKLKAFSYFSEMYADKRDAGKSEEQIIEEFGAPYDVAKRILDGFKETNAQAGGADDGGSVSGGNNYNYNYYNYNYGAPPQSPPPQEEYYAPPPPEYSAAQPYAEQSGEDVFGKGAYMPAKGKKESAPCGTRFGRWFSPFC